MSQKEGGAEFGSLVTDGDNVQLVGADACAGKEDRKIGRPEGTFGRQPTMNGRDACRSLGEMNRKVVEGWQ